MSEIEHPIEIECVICDIKFTGENFEGGTCPSCKRRYVYEEWFTVVLSDEDKQALK